MDVSPQTNLNQQLTFSYKSFAGSSQLADGSSPSDLTDCDLNKNHDLSHLPKEIPLKQLASGGADRSLSDIEETDEDCVSPDTPIPLCVISISFAIGAAIALFLHIHLRESSVLVNGVLVSDHERCTALGLRVLHDRGSSVDAAITAALCLGVVHPHVSGIGGGGVMLVHDIQKNQTRVINFQGTAPKTLKDEMLQNVSEARAGLHVGVPGMLRGLHHAHRLYGRLCWEDVITRVAAVAREGFNVSFSLNDAISKVKGQKLSQRFRDVFLPGGHALRRGSFLRMPGLAEVLEAGLSNFYDGNFSQEMEDEVRSNGGVMSRDDISSYSVQVEQPVEGLYKEFIIQAPPPPSAGAVLISVLRLLDDIHLDENDNKENQTHHWITKALRAALGVTSGLGDPEYNSSVNELLSDMLSKSQAEVLSPRINHPSVHSLQTEPMAGQVVVVGPDDLIVSVASSLSGTFGSRTITRSGVVLNSLILDFSGPNKTREQHPINQNNRVQPGKRPLSSLMPIIVVPAGPKCGMHLALSGSGGRQSLSIIAKVLIDALTFHKEKNTTLSVRKLPHQPLPNRFLADSDFLDEDVQVHRVQTDSAVQGILRDEDTITAITPPQLSDGLL